VCGVIVIVHGLDMTLPYRPPVPVEEQGRKASVEFVYAAHFFERRRDHAREIFVTNKKVLELKYFSRRGTLTQSAT
jgi:hypothetical protein